MHEWRILKGQKARKLTEDIGGNAAVQKEIQAFVYQEVYNLDEKQ